MSALPRNLFYAAAVLCLLGLLAHELVGAPMVLEPLENAGIPADIVWLHHFSWHVGSVAVAAMIAMFVMAGRKREHLILAGFATAISSGFALLGIGLAIFGNSALWTTPAPYPWTLVAIIGCAGLAAARKTT
ncbi:MAG: hypothetical protein V7676_00135 [Parasphingorhabdus sp.]|uniref:hypothetical protein n=1 Tax=Parasphingorhabdus sp. TaxID=2709688 RepID=UPI003000FBAC